MSMSLPLRPRMSEKSYGLSKLQNTYVFVVSSDSNKHTIARAVAAQFKVTVASVNVTTIKGKAKRTVRKGGRAVQGSQSTIKKAYVTLKKGDSLSIFAAEEQAEAEADKPKPLQKAMAKRLAKETK